MNYQDIQQFERILKMQLDMLCKMEEFIQFDEEYVKNHPNEVLPPVINNGVLKSHFITQKKACEGFLSYTARHLPRLKAEHDLANKKKVVESKKPIDAKTPIKEGSAKPSATVKNVPPTPNISNPQIHNSAFISLF